LPLFKRTAKLGLLFVIPKNVHKKSPY